MLRCLPLLAGLAILAACATPDPPQEKPEQASSSAAAPAPEHKPTRIATAPVAPRAKRPGPIPTRALNVMTDCKFRDETGYQGTMKLAVDQARVTSFKAAVTIPQRGTCRFDLANFRQTRELPNVELTHLRDPCIVRVWEQGERVTVAFQQCQKMCSGKAWDHLWPIFADRRDGSCA